jgi:hypothetical protein
VVDVGGRLGHVGIARQGPVSAVMV